MPSEQRWTAPPARRLTLGDDAVHVWRAPLDHPEALAARLAEGLSAQERERAARFRRPELAARFMAGRGIVRDVLARYLNARPAELRFAVAERGKPGLSAPHRWLRFNASNSGGLTLVAVTAGREVGVDVEEIRSVPEALAIADRMLSERERAALRALPEEQRQDAFLHCWTRKEAYIKAVGGGLWTGLDGFDVAFSPGEEARLLAVRGSAEEAARWTLRSLDPGAGFVGALVAEGVIGELAAYDWSPADGL